MIKCETSKIIYIRIDNNTVVNERKILNSDRKRNYGHVEGYKNGERAEFFWTYSGTGYKDAA